MSSLSENVEEKVESSDESPAAYIKLRHRWMEDASSMFPEDENLQQEALDKVFINQGLPRRSKQSDWSLKGSRVVWVESFLAGQSSRLTASFIDPRLVHSRTGSGTRSRPLAWNSNREFLHYPP